jgi:3-deoxy-7-phosphoheptulonate synthase
MRPTASKAEIGHVVERVAALGLRSDLSSGEERTIIGVIGADAARVSPETFEQLSGVERVIKVTKAYKLASREFHPADTIIDVKGVPIGGAEVILMAGPCAVEGRDQIIEHAEAVKAAGARILRGGAYKPRTGPYTFQGLGEDGLRFLREASERTGLPVITEVVTPEHVPLVSEYADILQIGARNMQNFELLRHAGRSDRAVMLKRGFAATYEELLLAAEYILSEGNRNVMLCERGIRTYEASVRFTLDILAFPVLERLTHLPVIGDPSHGTGRRELVVPVALAAVAAGADGLLIEVHARPEECFTNDGVQATYPADLQRLSSQIGQLAPILGRSFAVPPSAAVPV